MTARPRHLVARGLRCLDYQISLFDPVTEWCSRHGIRSLPIDRHPERGSVLLLTRGRIPGRYVTITEESGCLAYYSDAEWDTEFFVSVGAWASRMTSDPGIAGGSFPTLAAALEFALPYCLSALEVVA